MRQILGLPSTPAFLSKEAPGRNVAAFRCARHVLSLPHTSGLSGIHGGFRRLFMCCQPVVLELKWNRHVFKKIVAPAVVEHSLSVHQIYHDSRAVSSILSDTLDFR